MQLVYGEFSVCLKSLRFPFTRYAGTLPEQWLPVSKHGSFRFCILKL